MEKLSKSMIKKILILKVVGYIFFGLWFLAAMVFHNDTLGYTFIAVSILCLIGSTILYVKDYKRRQRERESAED
jgi:positive regulator of sigma E activity